MGMIEELELAKKMACATIQELYEDSDGEELDDVEIDMLLDAVKILCLVKQHTS